MPKKCPNTFNPKIIQGTKCSKTHPKEQKCPDILREQKCPDTPSLYTTDIKNYLWKYFITFLIVSLI